LAAPSPPTERSGELPGGSCHSSDRPDQLTPVLRAPLLLGGPLCCWPTADPLWFGIESPACASRSPFRAASFSIPAPSSLAAGVRANRRPWQGTQLDQPARPRARTPVWPARLQQRPAALVRCSPIPGRGGAEEVRPNSAGSGLESGLCSLAFANGSANPDERSGAWGREAALSRRIFEPAACLVVLIAGDPRPAPNPGELPRSASDDGPLAADPVNRLWLLMTTNGKVRVQALAEFWSCPLTACSWDLGAGWASIGLEALPALRPEPGALGGGAARPGPPPCITRQLPSDWAVPSGRGARGRGPWSCGSRGLMTPPLPCRTPTGCCRWRRSQRAPLLRRVGAPSGPLGWWWCHLATVAGPWPETCARLWQRAGLQVGR